MSEPFLFSVWAEGVDCRLAYGLQLWVLFILLNLRWASRVEFAIRYFRWALLERRWTKLSADGGTPVSISAVAMVSAILEELKQ